MDAGLSSSMSRVDLTEKTGKHIRELEQRFSEFWNKLSNVSGTPARREDVVVQELEQDEDTLSVSPKNPLLLKGLSCGDEIVDVWIYFVNSIYGVEVDSGLKYEIEKSTIRVQYLREEERDDEKVMRPIQGVRFEFEYLPEDYHPVFHAHFEPDCLKPSDVQHRYSKEVISYGEQVIDPPRVPSAPLDLTGVIYMILQDHKPSLLNTNKGWPARTQDAIKELPHFPEKCFEMGDDGSNRFSDWWYLHWTFDEEIGDAEWRVLERESVI